MSGGGREAGYSLVALIAGMTIMLIMMTAATPTWRYVMKNDREEELLFRGGEIADGIVRFQKRNGNAYPTSLDQLVKGKFIRRLYKEPFAKDGKWRFVHQGEPLVGGPAPGQGGPGSSTGFGNQPTPPPTTQPSGLGAGSGGTGGTSVGPIIGVASTSKEKSLRIFNGRTQYNEWLFVAGQPRILGRVPTPGPAPGSGVGPSPGPGSTTPPTTTPRPPSPP